MTGVKFERRWESQKTFVTIEFTTLTLCRVRNFIKIEAFAVLRPKLAWKMTVANIGRCQESQKTIVINEFSTFKLFTICKILWKMVNLIPRSLFPFPFLKIALFWLCIYIRKWFSLACLIPIPMFSLLSWFLYSSIYSKSTKSMKPNGDISTEWAKVLSFVWEKELFHREIIGFLINHFGNAF